MLDIGTICLMLYINTNLSPHFFRIRLFFMDKILKMRVRQTFEKEERLFQEIPHFQITDP